MLQQSYYQDGRNAQGPGGPFVHAAGVGSLFPIDTGSVGTHFGWDRGWAVTDWRFWIDDDRRYRTTVTQMRRATVDFTRHLILTEGCLDKVATQGMGPTPLLVQFQTAFQYAISPVTTIQSRRTVHLSLERFAIVKALGVGARVALQSAS